MAGEFPQRMSAFNCRTPGHEGSGVVVKLGENVKNWKIGDRAGVKPVRDICGACELCWGGQESYCRDAINSGTSATGSSGAATRTWGEAALANRIKVPSSIT